MAHLISKEDFERYFIKPNRTNYPLSGWKLHISGECEEDSLLIKNYLEDIIQKYKLSWKLSRQASFDVRDKKGKNKYKAGIIYFPVEIINSGKQKQIIHEISNALMENEYTKDLEIAGSKKIAPSIYYRYDMNIPLKKDGFSREEYFRHYKKSSESFNIECNQDIFN